MLLLRVVENRRVVVLFAVCFAAFFIPESYSVGVLVYRLWQVLLFSVSSAAFVAFLLWGRINIRWLLLCAFFAFFYVGSSLLAGADGSLALAAFLALKGIGFASVCELGFQRNLRACLEGFLLAGFILCAVHFLTYLLYRDVVGGMQHGKVSFLGEEVNQHWFFFTHDNASISYFIPVLAIGWLYAWRYSKKMAPVVAVATALTVIMYVDLWSAAALVSMIAFGVLVLALLAWRKCRGDRGRSDAVRILSPVLAAVLGLTVLTVVVLFASTDVMQQLIAKLGKVGAVYARIIIWENSLDFFGEKPICGMGLQDGATVIEQLTYDHSHNLLIQMLYQGGLLSAILFAAWLLACTARSGLRGSSSTEAALLAGALFLYLLASAMDWYGTMVTPLILAAAIPYVDAGVSERLPRSCERRLGRARRIEGDIAA